jgi:hypothetical protein
LGSKLKPAPKAKFGPTFEDECFHCHEKGLWRPRFWAGVVNPNEQVNSVDFGQTTVKLGHRPENITNNP